MNMKRDIYVKSNNDKLEQLLMNFLDEENLVNDEKCEFTLTIKKYNTEIGEATISFAEAK